jgi:(p)ppGpp synthase/HD superfamily hydrolase
MTVDLKDDHQKLTARFREALWFAAFLHADQVRKGTDIPYVAHLLAVAALVLEHGGGEDQAIAALLHDSAEDQGGKHVLDQIRDRFGVKVASIVEACTDTTVVPKPPWRERKERYIEHLAEVSEDVLLVSLADKVHNARAILADYKKIGDALWDRFQGKKDGTLWYYEALLEAFGNRGQRPELLAELKSVVLELRGLVESAEI